MLLNLTPHTIKLFGGRGDGEPLTELAPDEPTVRVQPAPVREVVMIDGHEFPVVRSADEIRDLPDPRPGVQYIVSAAVARLAHGREDLLVPNGLLTDDERRVLGCTGFMRYGA